jgi:hypothetical protein
VSVRQELAKRRAWLIGKGDVEATTSAQLAETLARPDDDATAQALAGITAGLASFLGVRGELAVVDGDAAGWRDVVRSLQCWKLRIAIDAGRYARGAQPMRSAGLEPVANVTALCACVATALRLPVEEGWLVAMLTTMHKDTRMVRPKWWTDHAVPSFIARLFGLGVIANVKPPHRAVLEQGNDERQLARALGAACDYHVEHMTIGNQGHEFADGPFGLVPFEVLTVLALRQRAGKTVATPAHELLAAPITSTWATVEPGIVDDPLLTALTERAGRAVTLAL